MLDGTNTATEVTQDQIEISTHVGEPRWVVADRELRKCARDRSRLDVREAGWLLEAVRTDAHRHRGCASFLEYLERVLGYGPQAAHDRIQVATALERLPRFRQAMLDGELVFSSARELARVITADTEDVWLDAAKGKTVREVQDKVSGRKRGDGPN